MDHKILAGVLLTDRSFHVLLLDNHRFTWSPKQTFSASFDIENAEKIVYSRTTVSLLWPVKTPDGCWEILMCRYLERHTGCRERTVLKGLPECSLEALRDELVILFKKHGVLFVDFHQLAPDVRFFPGRPSPQKD